jgi:hypothetical protein
LPTFDLTIALTVIVRFWHIATFGFTAKIGSYRGKADIKRVLANDPDL